MNEKLEKNENKKTADVLSRDRSLSELWEDPDVERRHF